MGEAAPLDDASAVVSSATKPDEGEVPIEPLSLEATEHLAKAKQILKDNLPPTSDYHYTPLCPEYRTKRLSKWAYEAWKSGKPLEDNDAYRYILESLRVPHAATLSSYVERKELPTDSTGPSEEFGDSGSVSEYIGRYQTPGKANVMLHAQDAWGDGATAPFVIAKYVRKPSSASTAASTPVA